MSKIGLIYAGHRFLIGVPARDLSPAEVKKYGRKMLLDSEIYIEPKPKKRTRAKQPKTDE